jgi:hemerythrin-like domain-containing protein
MKPTEQLMEEHAGVKVMLGVIGKVCTRMAAGKPVPVVHLEEILEFLKVFVDRCHHAKEEAHLFPAMEAAGSPRQCGPTAVMLREHGLGRLRVREMATAIDAAAAGDAGALQRFVENARAYIELLREHIEKEDHCLFPMANQLLTEKDQQALTAAFGRVEAEEMGEGTHETYLKLANALAEKYGVALAATVGVAGHACGCGH